MRMLIVPAPALARPGCCGQPWKPGAQAIRGAAAKDVIGLVQQELVQTRRRDKPESPGQPGIAPRESTELACRQPPRRQRQVDASVPLYRQQAEFGGGFDSRVRQRQIAAIDS